MFYRLTKTDLVITAVFVGIAVLLILGGIGSVIGTNVRFDSYGRCPAKVTDIETKVNRSARHRNTYYVITYYYEVGEKSYTAYDFHANTIKHPLGKEFMGYYKQEKPTAFYPDKYNGWGGGLLVSALASLVLAAGAVVEGLNRDDQERSKAWYRIIRGIFIFVAGIAVAVIADYDDMTTTMIIVTSGILCTIGILIGVRKLGEIKDKEAEEDFYY